MVRKVAFVRLKQVVLHISDGIVVFFCGECQPSDTVKSLLKKTGISDLFHDLKANRSIEGKAPVAREIKSKQRKLSPKAQARLEAEKAAKAAAEAPAAEEAQA